MVTFIPDERRSIAMLTRGVAGGGFRTSPRRVLPSAAVVWLIAFSVFACAAREAHAQRTWDGGPGGTGTELGVAANWTSDALPSTANNTGAVWNGTVAGNLSLIYSGSAFVGSSNSLGMHFIIRSGQTGSLLIDGTGTSATTVLRTGNITVDSGAGALSFGDGSAASGNFGLILSQGPLNDNNLVWTNNSANAVTFNSDVVFAAGGGNAKTITVTGSGNWSINTNLTSTVLNSGVFALVKSGSGAVSLNAANTSPAGMTLNSGTLNFNHAAAIGTGTFTITGGVLDNTTAAPITNTNNNFQNWNGDFAFTGTRDLNLGSGTVAMNASRAVAVNGGTLTVGGRIIGAGFGLTKTGAGRLVLSGSNAYTGATTISAGTLALGSAGSIASSGTVTVGSVGSTGAVLDLTAMASSYAFASGQRVQGIGTLDIGTEKTVSSAGIWAPGNSIGSNAVTGNLSLTGTSQFELGAPGTSTSSPGTSDFTAVSGALTLGGNLSLINNAGADGNGSAAGGVYHLFTYGTGVSGSYASVTTNPTPTTRTSLANITYGGSGTAAGQGVFLSVYNLAAGSVTSGTSINLGTVLKNTSLSQSLSISNTAPLGNFSEGLNASFGALSGGATTNSGSISLLAAGGTSTAMSVGLGSATAGAKSGSALVNFFSDGAGTSGLGAASVGSQTVSLTATVLDPAVASFTSGSIPSTSLTLTFGSVNEGETASQGFSLYNLLQTAGFTADLALVSIDETNPSGPFSTNLTQFNNLASGSFNSWQVFLDPAGQGTFSNTWTLQFKSANGSSVYTGDTPQTLTLTANVIIVPEPGAIALAGIGIALAGWAVRRRK